MLVEFGELVGRRLHGQLRLVFLGVVDRISRLRLRLALTWIALVIGDALLLHVDIGAVVTVQLVCVLAQGDRVIALVQNVAALVLVVVRRHVLDREGQRVILCLLRLQNVRLCIRRKDDGGFFDRSVVRRAVIELDDVFSRVPAFGPGIGDGNGDGDLTVLRLCLLDLLREGGIAEPVTEGIGHRVVIRSRLALDGKSPAVRIYGLVIAVSDVDALFVFYRVRRSDRVGGVDVRVCRGIGIREGRIRREVGDPGVHRSARRHDRAVEDLGKRVAAARSRIGHPDDRVDPFVLFERIDLHHVRAVDENDDIVKGGLCERDQILFFLGKLKLMLPVFVVFCLLDAAAHRRGALFEHAFHVDRKVHAFAAMSAEHDDRRVTVRREGIFDVIGEITLREFADVIGHIGEVVHRIFCNGHGRKSVFVHLGDGRIDLVARRFQRVDQRRALRCVARAAARYAEHGVHASAAEHGDAFVRRARLARLEREHALVFEKDHSLPRDALGRALRKIADLRLALAAERIILGVPAVRAFDLFDLFLAHPDIHVEHARRNIRRDAHGDGERKQDARDRDHNGEIFFVCHHLFQKNALLDLFLAFVTVKVSFFSIKLQKKITTRPS